MGKASSNKKVARAAGTGGGRTARGTQRPWGFYSVIGVVVVIGVLLVAFSRQQRIDVTNSDPIRESPPRGIGKNNEPADHFHMAYGFYICDHYLAPIPDNLQATGAGIHTHGDGIIHAEPTTEIQDAGKNATVGRFLSLAGITVTKTEIKIPASGAADTTTTTADPTATTSTTTAATTTTTAANGTTTTTAVPETTTTTAAPAQDAIDDKNGGKCGDKTANVHIRLVRSNKADDAALKTDFTGDPNKIHIDDQTYVVFAFVPDGTDIPAPTDALANLAKLKEDPAATEPTTTTLPEDTTGSTVPGDTSTTLAGSETPTTTAPGATTTVTTAPAATTTTKG